MNAVRFTVKTSSKLDMIKKIIQIYCLLSNIKLSETETVVICYFIIYGYSNETKQLIIDSKIVGGRDSLDNIISKLRKMGLIEGRGDKAKLNPQIAYNVTSVMGLFIKLDNA